MSESLADELLYVTCQHCGKVATFSWGALQKNESPVCPYCGEVMNIDIARTRDEALRKAQELDGSFDALGSHE